MGVGKGASALDCCEDTFPDREIAGRAVPICCMGYSWRWFGGLVSTVVKFRERFGLANEVEVGSEAVFGETSEERSV